MQYTEIGGEKCSRLMLGTVQFGLDYGISNKKGKVQYPDARDLVELALREGVNAFDTAPLYGDSEVVLGKIFSDLKIEENDIFLSDKIPPLPDGVSSRKAGTFIEDSITNSLDKLGVDYLDVCLFHREKDAPYLDELEAIVDKGLIGKAGVSVYSPGVVSSILENRDTTSAFQIPASLFDQRFKRAGIYEKAKEKGSPLFVRSVFLQGLIFMEPESLPADLIGVRAILEELRALCDEKCLDLAELAIRYSLALESVNSLVMGAESTRQLKQNLDVFSKDPLDKSLCKDIEGIVGSLPESVLLPFNWKKKNLNDLKRKNDE